MKMKLRFPLVILLITFQSLRLFSQQSAIYRDSDQDLKSGLEMYSMGQFGPAQANLARYLTRTEGEEATSRTDAAFYHAMCALRLGQSNGEQLVEQFLLNHPESAKAQLARFEMGNELFKSKKYKRALRWFQQVTLPKLNRELHAEYQFKTGYCLFDSGEIKRAQSFLMPVANQPGPWAEDAGYFYAYTHYQLGNYENALRGFNSLKESKRYEDIIPYYIAQIYYQQEKYEEVTGFAASLFRQANPDQQTEIARILGDSYFRLGRYAESIPYFEQYRRAVRSMSRDEHYALGFAYYHNKQMKEAIAELEQVSDENDRLTQNASHLLGGILIETGDKMKARSAFRKASVLDLNRSIQEESLLNYAKLNFDLSISGETLSAFEDFLVRFPDSEYTTQVFEYLVKVFMNTRNYKEALVTMDKIPEKNSDIQAAYQRIAYYRGLELFNNLQYREAVDHFNKSLEYAAFNPVTRALCYYWSGEAWYQLRQFVNAAKAFNTFLLSSGSYNLPEYDLAHYSLGYCDFSQENYDEALTWFRKFVNRAPARQEKLIADASNRIGDCYFMNRTYWQALDYYEKAAKMRVEGADYALFQKGFSLGLVQRLDRKIEVLNDLLTTYPKSSYCDDALFEIGRSYVEMNENNNAIRIFRDITQRYSNSSYARKSYLQMGLIFYNTDQNNEALAAYKKVADTWPDTQEAKDALAGIKNIYVDENRVDDYFAYLKTTGREGNVTVSEQDSLSYMAAVNLFMQGDCARAGQSFRQYINRFGQGSFLLNAHYYKADCDFRSAQHDDALSSYAYILGRGRNEYTEVALARSASIYLQREQWGRALELYELLAGQAEVPLNLIDARVGIMRCAYRLKDFGRVIDAANAVLLTDKIPDETIREATYVMGKSYLELGDEENALDVFGVVAQDVKNAEGAEAKYLKSLLLFKKGNYDQAEKEVLEFLDQNTTHQFWLAKTYILWSDIYLKRNDLFQARATLQILKETYRKLDDGIIKEVDEKLQWIQKQNEQ